MKTVCFCKELLCGGAFRRLITTFLCSKKGFPSCESGRMKPEQQQFVPQVIIVHPNHSCSLSLLRFYPLITSAPPGGPCLAHIACSSRPELAGLFIRAPIALHLMHLSVPGWNPPPSLPLVATKRLGLAVTQTLPPSAGRWSLAAHSLWQLHIFQTLVSIEAIVSFRVASI